MQGSIIIAGLHIMQIGFFFAHFFSIIHTMFISKISFYVYFLRISNKYKNIGHPMNDVIMPTGNSTTVRLNAIKSQNNKKLAPYTTDKGNTFF